MTRHCEMAGCDRYDATVLYACGIYYVCPPHRVVIERLSAEMQAEARLAEQAGATQ